MADDMVATPGVSRLPGYLRRTLGRSTEVDPLRTLLREQGLHTVCEEARCPNRGECFSHGTATFMIGGDRCTRRCHFCNVGTGRPAALNPAEPDRLAEAAARMKLRHVVITSVDRDDLPDGGALHWAHCISAVRRALPSATVEVLTPDFKGEARWLDVVLSAGPHVFAHNTETVERLYQRLRPQSRFVTTLGVLRRARGFGGKLKTGIMVGLGETDAEVVDLMGTWASLGVDIITIGQYLRPSLRHWPVHRYVTPETFDTYAARARGAGIPTVFSAPLVRSSYHAEETFLAVSGASAGSALTVLP